MRRCVASLAVIAGLFGVLTPFVVQAEPIAPLEPGVKFSAKGLDVPENTFVIDVRQSDVNGDGVDDDVVLLGGKETAGDHWNSAVILAVRDGKTAAFSRLGATDMPEDFAGYEPGLFVGDFTGDQVGDILVTVGTGGSGGVYRHLIVNWKENRAVIFADEENQGLRVKGKFADGFKAELSSDVLGKSFTVDLGSQKKRLVEYKLYDQTGQYVASETQEGNNAVDIVSDPFRSLYPVDVDQDGVYELAGNQYVWGPSHVNGITEMDSVWKWKENKWVPLEVTYTVTQTLLSQE